MHKEVFRSIKYEAFNNCRGRTTVFWHANLITLNRRKTVVLVNDKNRYIVVLYGLKAKDFKKIDELIVKAVRETFQDECIKGEVIDKFLNHSKETIHTKTKDRTSVARMNKACEAVVYYTEELLYNESVFQSGLSIRASRYLMGYGKNEYIDPHEEMFNDLEAFSEQPIFRCKAAELKVTLALENHNVWRRLMVPLNMTFSKLHEVLQEAFGWKEYHLHEFYIYENEVSENKYSDETFINHPAFNRAGYKPIVKLVCGEDAFEYPDEIEMKLECNIRLSEYLTEYKRLKYNYDFGDNWQHYIEVEKIVEDYDKNYPVCLEGEGNTPPEDVGGENGYEEFLEIISDVNNPEYDSMLAWGKSQGYKKFDVEMVNRRIKSV
jgi:hypothetical protein